MYDNNNFFIKYIGAIIGAIIGIILFCTGLYKVVLFCIAVIGGAFLGNYVQNNKEIVKEKLKNFVDKL